MKKELLSIMTVKTVLAIAVITGLGTIIFGGGVVIMKYYNSEINNRTARPVDQETEWRNCKQDSDCVETQADCCNCNSGGKQIGINKKYLKSWENALARKCQGIGCIALFNCKEGKVVCESNKCEFKEEINNNNQPNTSDWQTYRNEEFGFEMKYPEDWKFYKRSYKYAIISSYNLDSQFPDSDIDENGVRIEITIELLNQSTLFESLKNEDNYYFDSLSNISLNGYDAYKLSMYFTDWYFLSDKNEKIRIDITVRNSHSNENVNFIGDQILSSFKFTD